MTRTAIGFVLLLTVILGASFGIHAYVQDGFRIGAFEKHIILNYCFNYLLTIGVFIALVAFQRKNSDQLGFVFLASSVIKFILFFIFLYPSIKASVGLRSVEFASFFIPYGISVLVEILYLMRALKSKN